MPEPVHRTFLLTDIENSGAADDVVRAVRRNQMYETVQSTLEAAGVPHTDQRLEDRGDGVMALIAPGVPKTALLRALLTEVPARLHGYNRVAAGSAQVRLRIVLAAGEVTLHARPGTPEGALGADLDRAFRLLDSEPLREALRQSTQDAVLCVSEAVHEGVVRHDYPGIPVSSFHPLTVRAKEGPLRAWVHGARAAGGPPPGHASGTGGTPAPDPAAHPAGGTGAAPAPAGGGVVFAGGSPSFGDHTVLGDQNILAGGKVEGGFFMGGKHVGPDEENDR